MSCPDARGRQREESLRNSTIARLLLEGKLQESVDVRPPPMDLSVKKSTDNVESKCSSIFGVRELLNGSQSVSTNISRFDSKLSEALTCQTSNSEATDDKNALSLEKDVCKREPQSSEPLKVNIMPDSMGDPVPKMSISPFVLVDRPRSNRCSEALRSLLLKPSTLLMNKTSPNSLQGNRHPTENGILENSELQTKCDFAELYFYGDKLLSRAYNATLRPRNCCLKEEKFTSVIKKEDTLTLDVKQVQSVNKSAQEDLTDIRINKVETPIDKKQWKVKRKIKSESPEYSSGSNSRSPDPHVISDQKECPSPSLKLHYPRVPVSLDVKQGKSEGCNEEARLDEHANKNECDYDTFRKFKRFRKCLPDTHANPVADNPGACHCNLKNLIQEIKSTGMSSLVDKGTQCFSRNFADASTQYDIPATPVATYAQHARRAESESENGVTEGISLTNEVHLKCFHCGITFEDDVIHSIHMGCHCHRDPFICNLCGRQCDNKYVFNTHILRGHQSV